MHKNKHSSINWSYTKTNKEPRTHTKHTQMHIQTQAQKDNEAEHLVQEKNLLVERDEIYKGKGS